METTCSIDTTCDLKTLTYIPITQSLCLESDGGLNYGQPKTCKDEGACAAGCPDTCIGSSIKEYYCVDTNSDGLKDTCTSTTSACPLGVCN